MELVTTDGIRYDCQNPILTTYGIAFLCSGEWTTVSWDEVSWLKVSPTVKLERHAG